MDKLLKVTNNELGTITATLAFDDVSSLHLTPTPDKAPGIIVLNAGTAEEEAIYYDTKDAGTGVVATLVRDVSNLNGGVGREHANGSPWETMFLAEYFNGLVDFFLAEHKQSGIHKGPIVEEYTPADAETATIDLNVANRNKIQMPAGNITVAFDNEAIGQHFYLEITQDAVGSRSITWPAGIKWANGAVPVLSGANKIDRIGFVVNDTGEYFGTIIDQAI